MNQNGSAPELFVQHCGYAMDSSPDGKYVLASMMYGDRVGIYELSLADRKCTTLVPGMTTFIPRFSQDGKFILYSISARGEVILYRIPWSNGKITGPSQQVLKLPFAFPQRFGGNAYDIARDLSKIVYSPPAANSTSTASPTNNPGRRIFSNAAHPDHLPPPHYPFLSLVIPNGARNLLSAGARYPLNVLSPSSRLSFRAGARNLLFAIHPSFVALRRRLRGLHTFRSRSTF